MADRNRDPAPLTVVDPGVLETYLQSLFGASTQVLSVDRIGGTATGDVKRFGYGTAFHVAYRSNGRDRAAVFQTVRPGPHGHETMADRAQLLLSNYHTFSSLPRHVRALDVGEVDTTGALRTLGNATELFILTEYAEGTGHDRDFFRIRDSGVLTEEDLRRSDQLCDYLVKIHAVRKDDPGLYARRIRELVGHGECIMGLTDAYPERHGFIDRDLLEQVEHQVVRWRWRLKARTSRLCQVHGDFHPWNILFEDDGQFHILDRSRGEWGEAADDVSCLTVNYLFFSLQRNGRLDGAFQTLFTRFWARYLEQTGDRELLSVVAPFFAFRGLVLASPVWYPDLSDAIRRRIFSFVRNVLDAGSFEPDRVNDYCEA